MAYNCIDSIFQYSIIITRIINLQVVNKILFVLIRTEKYHLKIEICDSYHKSQSYGITKLGITKIYSLISPALGINCYPLYCTLNIVY